MAKAASEASSSDRLDLRVPNSKVSPRSEFLGTPGLWPYIE
jgi:hypothetical protein